jgi:Icc-related predicted phosphoesterase
MQSGQAWWILRRLRFMLNKMVSNRIRKELGADMKIFCISDTHGYHRHMHEIPEADVVVHAGDICNLGSAKQTEDFLDWFRALPMPHKVLIAGNHDFLLDTQRQADLGKPSQSFDFSGIHYLMDDAVEINGVTFYGSPWQPEFQAMAFNLPREGDALRQAWRNIPEATDVLVTHTPPYGILDQTNGGFGVGCELLTERLGELPQVKAHVFGHVHEAAGYQQQSGRQFVNAFEPRVIEI